MRSLWRILAMQWLGGNGSEGLAEESTVLESLISGEPPQPSLAFSVRREPVVSHHAMLSPISGRGLEPKIALEEVLRWDMPRRYPP